jgi:hypothetical protein
LHRNYTRGPQDNAIMQVSRLLNGDHGILGRVGGVYRDRLMIRGIKGLAGFDGDALDAGLTKHA